MSRVARIFSTVLITAGLVVMADVGLTVAYKEPISSLYGELQQAEAEDQLADLETEYPTAADLAAIRGVRGLDEKAKVLAERFAEQAKEAEAIGRILAPVHGHQRGLPGGDQDGHPSEGPRPLPRHRVSRARARRSGSPAIAPPTWRRFGRSTR